VVDVVIAKRWEAISFFVETLSQILLEVLFLLSQILLEELFLSEAHN